MAVEISGDSCLNHDVVESKIKWKLLVAELNFADLRISGLESDVIVFLRLDNLIEKYTEDRFTRL